MAEDEQASVTDDAVSNRSDDTTLEEAEGAGTNGQQPEAGEPASDEVLRDQAIAAENEPVTVGGDEMAESVDSVGAEEPASEEAAADEDATDTDELEEEAAPRTPRGPIELTPE